MSLTEFTEVRVIRTLRPPEAYDAWGLNQRPPIVGEVGTVVDVLRSPGLPDRYVVENSGPDGIAIWLGEFGLEELEPVRPVPPPQVPRIHIIYSRAQVLLSRVAYRDWREIQAAVPDYVASLGPWSPEDVTSFLQNEYDDLEPDAATQVRSFTSGAAAEALLTFRSAH